MRVKLSYTVEEEDVLKEAAKILGLSSDDVKEAIDLFQAIPAELNKRDDDDPPNVHRVVEMIGKFRQALLSVDTRLLEVTDIIDGYDKYRIGLRPTSEADAGVE